MLHNKKAGLLLAGMLAGTVTGLLGAGGGMVLVPLLSLLTALREEQIFPASLSIILPICVTALVLTPRWSGFSWGQSFPYLLGSALGGFAAGKWGQRIPVLWLHRGLGVLILWGGYRNLC